jgi:hypothetical protein
MCSNSARSSGDNSRVKPATRPRGMARLGARDPANVYQLVMGHDPSGAP